MGYEEGHAAEDWFAAQMEAKGMPTVYKNTWYDFDVHDVRVEVKSCKLCVKKGERWEMGRFHFNDEYNRTTQYDENVWVCFIVYYFSQRIILGFVEARKLEKKRNISIAQVRALKPLQVDEWVKKIWQ